MVGFEGVAQWHKLEFCFVPLGCTEDSEDVMSILYQLFYTVFSMSCMIVVLTPIVLLLRFIFRKLPRKFTMALWTIFYLRAVCPVGMSSPVCLFGKWNRQFHLLLRSIGLQITPDKGLMTSWLQVYQSHLDASVAYIVCTVFWIAGFAGMLLFAWKRQLDVKRKLGDATLLFDNVYQSDKLQSPMRSGIFRQNIYLPDGLSAREMKNILLHQQLHCERKDDWMRFLAFLISCLHWWNPCIWLAYYLSGIDGEMACDEAVVRRIGWSKKSDYAQDILNMKKEGSKGVMPQSLISFRESRLSARAEHMLYMMPVSVWKKALSAFLLTLCVFCWFALSALHTAWNGGEWGRTEDIREESLFPDNKEKGVTNEVIAHCDSQTPEGTAVRLELLMTQGTYQKEKGYTGQCILRMQDEQDNTLASLTLSRIFVGEKVQQFGETVELSVDDYNEDGVMEISIGQKMEVEASKLSAPVTKGAVSTGTAVGEKKGDNGNNGKKTVYGYYLINLEENQLRIISEPIYVSDVTDLQAGSITFSYIEDAEGVITTQLEEDTAYYVWDKEDKMYYRQLMTQEEIDARRAEPETSPSTGEANAYNLKNGEDQIVMRVAARTDDTGSQSIENVIINPKGVDKMKGTKEYTDITGYFVKLEWAQDEKEPQRYAVLTYNGKGGQTFVVYDVEKRKVCFRQEDGNKGLKKLFEQFNETDITFSDSNMVVYSLMEISDTNLLKIGFAANAEGGITVQGSYSYNVSTGKTSNFQYTQELN